MVLPRVDPDFNRAYVDNLFAQANKKYVGGGVTTHTVHFGYKRANGNWELVTEGGVTKVATAEPDNPNDGDYWDINTRDYPTAVGGFSWGDINFTLNGVTKQMVYPTFTFIKSDDNEYYPNTQPPFTDLNASGASATARNEGVPTAVQAYVVRPLIYTVQTNSFVILSVLCDLSNAPDYVHVLFRPNPQSYYDNIWNTYKDAAHAQYRKYPSLFAGWNVLGAQPEIYGDGGDPIVSYQIPCQAGAKFAFMRTIFSPGSNLNQFQTTSYSKGIDTSFKGPNHAATGMLPVHFNTTTAKLKSSTLGIKYGWDTVDHSVHVKPNSNVIRVLEIPMYA